MSLNSIGAVLISNTFVCETATVFSKDWHDAICSWPHGVPRLNLRIADVMSLLDAAVLHDKLYTLPGRRQEVHQLTFRNLLIREGIVEELDTRGAHAELASTLIRWLSAVPDPSRLWGKAAEIGQPISFADLRESIEEFLLLHSSDVPTAPSREGPAFDSRVRLDDPWDHGYEQGDFSRGPLSADCFTDFGKRLLALIESSGTGAYGLATSVLRDAYYVLVSEHTSLPYWPESTRVRFARQFPNYFDNTERLRLYSRLAELLRTTARDVFDDHAGQPAFAPPFAALILSRSSGVDDLPDKLLEVRAEYARFRSNLNELEQERRRARSIRKRLRLRARQRSLVVDLASKFERPSSLSLEAILRYVPDVVTASQRPTDPSSYSAELLLKPADVLIRWWIRRPVSALFDLSERLKDVMDYGQLITRVFGPTVGEGIRERRHF